MEDVLYRFLKLFNSIPLPLKKFIGYLYNLLPTRTKYGSFYFKYSDRLKSFNSNNFNETMDRVHDSLLFNQVNKAIDQIPFYRNCNKVSSYHDFLDLPVINKGIIIDSFDDFYNKRLRRRRIVTNTGGSSGTPLKFFIEKNTTRPKEKAHFDWFWGKFGYVPNSRILVIRGHPLQSNRFYEYNPINNQLSVSCYDVNERNIEKILHRINGFNPSFIHAYPSSLKIITSLLNDYKDQLSIQPEAIFLGSEQIFETDRDYFRKFYQTRIVNWYGHSERLIHGGTCPYSDEYHFYASYGHIELLDENDQTVNSPGKEGRIVATGFDNSVMPFIRYDTGDLGILSEKASCQCGFRGVMLRGIKGRSQDLIILSDNTKVSLTAFIFGQHIEAFNRVRELQILQLQIGKIELKMVKTSGFSTEDEETIINRLSRSVNGRIQIEVSYLNSLPKTKTGKHVFFISQLNNQTSHEN